MNKSAFCFLVFIVHSSLHIAAKDKAKIPKGFENRCGWIHNPTPANWWITDKDGQWILGVQGGHQAEGDIPEFPEKASYWKKTNVHYGYGCGCLVVQADAKEKLVKKIHSGKPAPLSKCRADKSLPKPD